MKLIITYLAPMANGKAADWTKLLWISLLAHLSGSKTSGLLKLFSSLPVVNIDNINTVPAGILYPLKMTGSGRILVKNGATG